MNKSSKKVGLFLSLFLGFSLFNSLPVLAGGGFELKPILTEFSPSGSTATQSFVINSTGDKPVAIQLSMATREISLDGTETNVDADDQFLIYPPQLVIPPGEQQTVRVTWLGDPNPAKELAFRIIAEQVPVDLTTVTVRSKEGNTALIKVLFRYRGSVYIKPEGVAPKLIVENANAQKSKTGAEQLVINVANQGTAHQLLQNIKVMVTASSGKSVTLAGKQLEGVLGENILADSKRQFILPWPKELPVGPVTATFDTNP